MRIVVYGPERRVGMIQQGHVLDASNAYARYLELTGSIPDATAAAATVVPPRLNDFITAGRQSLDSLETAALYLADRGIEKAGTTSPPLWSPLDAVTLHAPYPHRRIACAGSNYSQHSAGMALARGDRLQGDSPDAAVRQRGIWGFWKVPEAPVGPDGDIIYPTRTERLDYEGEVAVVLGKRGKDISADAALPYLWGVTLLIDWSIRDAREIPQSRFALNKNFDTSVSLGPCIAVDEVRADEVEVKTFVNDELRQHYNSSTMVFSFGEYIEYLSRDFTLVPGDIISGGTGAGTAMDSSRKEGSEEAATDKFLRPGDAVVVISPQIGELSAHVIAKPVIAG